MNVKVGALATILDHEDEGYTLGMVEQSLKELPKAVPLQTTFTWKSDTLQSCLSDYFGGFCYW